MNKYEAETKRQYISINEFTHDHCLITFQKKCAKVINDSWYYSRYWSLDKWPEQAKADCLGRIDEVERDLKSLRQIYYELEKIIEAQNDSNN